MIALARCPRNAAATYPPGEPTDKIPRLRPRRDAHSFRSYSRHFSRPHLPLPRNAAPISRSMPSRTARSREHECPSRSGSRMAAPTSIFAPTADGGSEIVRVSAATGATTVVAPAQSLVSNGTKLKVESISISHDASKILLFHNSVRVWRQNTRGVYDVLDVATGRVTPLSTAAGLQMFAKFSPDGRRVAFVRANNLFVTDLATHEEHALTNDGSDVIINGTSDWVYEEELAIRDAFRWSPDSKRIAFWRFDQSPIPIFPMVDELSLVAKMIPERYPRPGDRNSKVTVGVVNADTRADHVAAHRRGRVHREHGVGGAGQRRDSAHAAHAESDRPPDAQRGHRRRSHRAHRAQLGLGGRGRRDTALAVERNDVPLAQRAQRLAAVLSLQARWHARGARHARRCGRLIARRRGREAWLRVRDRGRAHADAATALSLSAQGWLGDARDHRAGLAPREHLAGWHRDGRHPLDGAAPWRRVARVAEHRAARGTCSRRTPSCERRSRALTRAPEFFQVPMPDGTKLNAFRILPPAFDSTRKYPVLMYVYGGPDVADRAR